MRRLKLSAVQATSALGSPAVENLRIYSYICMYASTRKLKVAYALIYFFMRCDNNNAVEVNALDAIYAQVTKWSIRILPC